MHQSIRTEAGPLVNAVLRAIPARALGVPEKPYREWAAWFAGLGYPANRDNLKNAARRGKLELGKLTVLSDAERVFAEALLRACPTIDLAPLAAPGSPAETQIRASSEAAREAIAGDQVVSGCIMPYTQATPGGDGGKKPGNDNSLDVPDADQKTGVM